MAAVHCRTITNSGVAGDIHSTVTNDGHIKPVERDETAFKQTDAAAAAAAP